MVKNCLFKKLCFFGDMSPKYGDEDGSGAQNHTSAPLSDTVGT